MTKYIIEDWAGNKIDTLAMSVSYRVSMGIPKQTFDSFEDAEEFLSEVLGDSYEEDRQEYYIVEKK